MNISYKTYHINRGWSGEFQSLPESDTPILLGYINQDNEIINDLWIRLEKYNDIIPNSGYHEITISFPWIGYQKTSDTNCQLLVAVASNPEDLWKSSKIYSLNNYIGNINYTTASIKLFIETNSNGDALYFAIRSLEDQVYCNCKGIIITKSEATVKKAVYYDEYNQIVKEELFIGDSLPSAPPLQQKLGYQKSWKKLTEPEENTQIYNIETSKIPYQVLISNNIDKTKIELGTCVIDSVFIGNIPVRQGYVIDPQTIYYKDNKLQLYVTADLLTKQNNTYVLDLKVLYQSEKTKESKEPITIFLENESITFSPGEQYYLPANIENLRVEYWEDETTARFYSPYCPYDYNTMILLQGKTLTPQILQNLAPWPLFQKLGDNNYAPIEIFVWEEIFDGNSLG